MAAKLVEGRRWSSTTSCVATEDGKTVSIRRQESARVRGRTRTHIGDKAIDTWIIERRIISTKRIGAVTVVVDEAINELFAPSLGLNVYRLSQTDTPRPNGGVETLVESIQLLSDHAALASEHNGAKWWGYLDSNQGPQHYQCCALTN